VTAYRSASLTPPVAPPLWQRAVAAVVPDVLGASAWEWYRRAKGGRWAPVRVALTDGRGNPMRQWRAVDSCPATWRPESAVKATTLMLLGIDIAALHNDTIDDHTKRCTCEVYP
jgi:hypothetical protein